MLFLAHPLPYGRKIMKSLILKKNLIKEWMKILSQVMLLKTNTKNSKLQEENFSLLYTPYEDISSNKFENEIEESPPNTQEDFILVIDDETSQANLQQEALMEEMNLEKNDETRILNVEKEEK
jgi:hypothetical protein